MKTSFQESLRYDDMCVLLGEVVFDKIKNGINPGDLCMIDVLKEESSNRVKWSKEKRLIMIQAVEELS